jgi:hypothetical protein
MQVKDIWINTRHEVRLSLEHSDERMSVEYNRTGAQFRPSAVRVSWNFATITGWELDTLVVSGPKVKKDGTDAQGYGKRTFHYGRDIENAPAWLTEMVERYEATRPAVA